MLIHRLWNAPVGKADLIKKGIIQPSFNSELTRVALEAYNAYNNSSFHPSNDTAGSKRRKRKTTRRSTKNLSISNDVSGLTLNDYFFEHQKVKGYVHGTPILSQSKEIQHFQTVVLSQIDKYFTLIDREAAETIQEKVQSGIVSLDLWAAIQKSDNSYHKCHVHEGALLSGVYYSCIPKESAPLTFHKYDENLEGLDELSICPQEGQIILFPPWMPHEVPPRNYITERVSYAFNLSGPYIGDPWEITRNM